jgi:hypothetical protein
MLASFVSNVTLAVASLRQMEARAGELQAEQKAMDKNFKREFGSDNHHEHHHNAHYYQVRERERVWSCCGAASERNIHQEMCM